MNRRKFGTIAVGFALLVVLVVVLLMSNSLRRSSHIVLPAVGTGAASGSGPQQPGSAVVTVTVTPETVQDAIASLTRPDSYVRQMTAEQLWSGGSASFKTEVRVLAGWTRTDFTGADGSVRHAVTDGKRTYIWYNRERSVFAADAGDISADEEQHLPTYEDILELDPERIAAADYRTFSDEDCIYVETAADEDGYVLRYWVSVESGLLIGNEKLLDGQAIYRLAAQPLQDTAPTAADFTLPDGTVLTAGT